MCAATSNFTKHDTSIVLIEFTFKDVLKYSNNIPQWNSGHLKRINCTRYIYWSGKNWWLIFRSKVFSVWAHLIIFFLFWFHGKWVENKAETGLTFLHFTNNNVKLCLWILLTFLSTFYRLHLDLTQYLLYFFPLLLYVRDWLSVAYKATCIQNLS